MHTDLSGTLGVLLAGGQGTRLFELTAQDCKPALPFAGHSRIVDFTMANAVRSGLQRLLVATQYQPDTLHRHLTHRWSGAFADAGLQLREGRQVMGTPTGYLGTAHAVAANMAEINAAGVDTLVVLSGDHIYEMDYAAMVADHHATGAAVTVAAGHVPRQAARAFGVLTVNEQGQITQFAEKPAQPAGVADAPDQACVSLGVYVFALDWLRVTLQRLLMRRAGAVDFGHDVLPMAVQQGMAQVYMQPDTGGQAAYWRDVGTLDAYRLAQLDFADGQQPCALPTVTGQPAYPGVSTLRPLPQAADVVFGGMAPVGAAQGGQTVLDQSVVLPGACVLPGARLTRVIVAPRTVVPSGLVVGEDAGEDARWFRRTDAGTTLVTNDMLARRQSALLGRRAPVPRMTLVQSRMA
jgi:glucose-1-phosphate adenylyltransferase